MTQPQSPLGWGHPGSERRQSPPQGSAPPPIHTYQYDPMQAAYISQMEVRSTIAEYPAGDKPFVGPTIGGIVCMITAMLLVALTFALPDAIALIMLAVLALGITGSIMVIVGAYRLLNALQVMYLLIRRL